MSTVEPIIWPMSGVGIGEGGHSGQKEKRMRKEHMCVTTINILLFQKPNIAISKKYSKNKHKFLVYTCLYFSFCYENGQKQAFFIKKKILELILAFYFLVFAWFWGKLTMGGGGG